jgi:tetratricopeptide (TPR) repeat protein
MAGEPVLDVFVSSPGDVQRERDRVEFVVARLNSEYHGRVQIRAIRWETRFYSSHDTFQAQIPEAAASDLVVAIFGSRLGSPLPETFPPMSSGEPYPSGSAYEVLTAIEARRGGKGIPDIYVFRRPRAPVVALDAADRDDVEAQWRRLTGFFETWFRNRGGQFIAAFQEFATTDEFAVKVEDCLRQWLTRRGFAPRSATWNRRELGSPYPGLAPFDETRQLVFFGRSLVVEQAIQRLRAVEAPASDSRAPFLLLIGASGSGKSSLLRAGLLPRVALPGILPEVDLWRRAIVIPGPDPFLNLAESLLLPEALGPELARGPFRAREILAKQLAGDPDVALAPLHEALERAAAARQKAENFEAPRPSRLFLAIDQAERLLFEAPPEPRARFAQLLSALCRHRVATVVMALRSDAYPRFQAVDTLVGLRDAGATLDLLPPTASELEEMATRPAALCEPPLAFQQRDGRSLAAELVADAKGGDALPLLQMTLARLSAAEAARGDGVLRFADYQGLGEAVTQTANEALAGLDADARAQLPRLIAGLVRDVAADPLTGQPTPMIGALDRARFEAGRPERKALVEAFVGKRLLIAEGDAESQRVRPTHESLLRIWPEAVAIVAEVGDLIRTRQALEPIARAWADAPEGDKTRHLEVSPALLEGAQRYLERFGDDASPTTRDFVATASAVAEARRDRERQEQERRVADAQAIAAGNRRIAQRTGIGLFVALVLAGAAGWEWRTASIAEHEATKAIDAATRTADGLVFDLAQKFASVSGVQKSVVKDILEKARGLQEQLIDSGGASSKLSGQHANALAMLARTEQALGDGPAALTLARQARDIYASLATEKPDDLPSLHNSAVTGRTLGAILQQQGDFDGALAAYQQARSLVDGAVAKGLKLPQLPYDQALLREDLGALAEARGDLTGALALFREGLAIAGSIPDAAPDHAAQHALAIANRNIGDVLLKQGEIDAAVAAFDAASALSGRLAKQNPDNTDLQRDFSLSQERLGKALTAKRDYAGALKAYDDGEATAMAMAAKDPSNLGWQYDISIGHIEIGDTQMALGDVADAIGSYGAAAAIDRFLTTTDPTNADWRGQYWIAIDNQGDALARHGEFPAALAAYRQALAFAQSIVAGPANDATWRRRVLQSEQDIGYVLIETGDNDGALAAYQDALAGARTLAAAPGASDEARFDLLLDLLNVAHALTKKGDDTGALANYTQAEGIARALIAANPKAARARGSLADIRLGSGRLLLVSRRTDDAIAAFREAMGLAKELSLESATGRLWQLDVANAYDGLGDALADKGDLAGAIDAYRASLAADQTLPAASLSDPSVRAREAATQEAIGAALRTQKDSAGELAAMQAAVALRQGLSEGALSDPASRRLQLSDERAVGGLLSAAGDKVGALAAYQAGLVIARELAARADADATTRADLAWWLSLVGSATPPGSGAAAAFAEGLSIAQPLADAAPANPRFQSLVAHLGADLGAARSVAGDNAGALAAYVEARDAAAALVALNPKDTRAAAGLKAIVGGIGQVAMAMLLVKDFQGALAALDKATPAAPDQNWFDLVRAACLMFLDRPDEARALYLKHRGETTYAGKSWETATKDGFALLRAHGLDNPLMAEIEAQK